MTTQKTAAETKRALQDERRGNAISWILQEKEYGRFDQYDAVRAAGEAGDKFRCLITVNEAREALEH